MGRINGSPFFDAAERGKQFRGRYLPDGPGAQQGVIHLPGKYAHAVGLRPARRMTGEPLPRNDLVGVFTPGLHRLLYRLPLRAGVYALGNQLPGIFPSGARLFQPRGGVSAERKQLFLAPKPELEPPPAAPAGVTSRKRPAPS